jgi:undecaprenyl-diphosphatase
MRRSRAGENQNEELDNLTMAQALGIGLFQCLAVVPGTSRSGATILGGRILGVSRPTSAEFSFFMAIPVMFGWSLLKVIKELVFGALTVTATEWTVLIVGSLVAFVVSLLTIRFLISYVQKNSFRVFGYYRIVLGIIVIAYFAVNGSLLS